MRSTSGTFRCCNHYGRRKAPHRRHEARVADRHPRACAVGLEAPEREARPDEERLYAWILPRLRDLGPLVVLRQPLLLPHDVTRAPVEHANGVAVAGVDDDIAHQWRDGTWADHQRAG